MYVLIFFPYFILGLAEIQTMNVSRCPTSNANGNTVKDNQNKPIGISPMKPINRPDQSDRNGYVKVSNGKPDNTRELDFDGGEDDYDFNESASMIKPNNVQMMPRKPVVPDPISEGSHSGEEQYPLTSHLNQSGMRIDYEKELWKQKVRPVSQQSIASIENRDFSSRSKTTANSNGSCSGGNSNSRMATNAKPEDPLEKPKSTVSFLHKLEMRKKQRAAAAAAAAAEKQPISEEDEDRSRYAAINIIPAGYQMGAVKFENGKVIAGNKEESSESKPNSWGYSKPRNFGQQDRGTVQQQRPQNSDEYDTDSGKVYVTKHGSRFDRVIEDEAW